MGSSGSSAGAFSPPAPAEVLASDPGEKPIVVHADNDSSEVSRKKVAWRFILKLQQRFGGRIVTENSL
jgi:hypothetical protein